MTKDKKVASMNAKRRVAAGFEPRKAEHHRRPRQDVGENRDKTKNQAPQKKERVGRPGKPLQGRRSTDESRRESLRINRFMDLIDPAAGSRFVPGFPSPGGDNHFAILLRFFFNHIYDFYSPVELSQMIRHFCVCYRLDTKRNPIDFLKHLKSLRSNAVIMRDCVDAFGPAFVPNGRCWYGKGDDKQNVVILHNIPIADGSLLRAQMSFSERRLRSGKQYPTLVWKSDSFVVKHDNAVADKFRGHNPYLRMKGAGFRPNPAKFPDPPVEVPAVSTATQPPSVETTKPLSKTQQKKLEKAARAALKTSSPSKNDERKTSVPLPPGGVSGALNGAGVDGKSKAPSTNPLTTVAQLKAELVPQWGKFHTIKDPKGKLLHDIAEVNDTDYLDRCEPVECHGAPFCGYVSILQAAGKEVVFDDLVKILLDSGERDPYLISYPDLLETFASSHGFNLMILKRVANDPSLGMGFVTTVTDKGLSVIQQTLDPSLNKWIILLHTGDRDAGHYVPMQGPKVQDVNPLPTANYPDEFVWTVKSFHRMIPSKTFVDGDKMERRNPQSWREPANIADQYSGVVETKGFKFNPVFLIISLFWMISISAYKWYYHVYPYQDPNSLLYLRSLNALLSISLLTLALQMKFRRSNFIVVSVLSFVSWLMLPFFMSKTYYYAAFRWWWYRWYMLFFHVKNVGPYVSPWTTHQVFCAAMVIFPLLLIFRIFYSVWNQEEVIFWEFTWSKREFVVSNVMSNIIYTQLNTSDIDDIDWTVLNRIRWLKTNMHIPGLVTNTRIYMTHIASTLRAVNTQLPNTVGLIAYNTPTTKAYIPPQVLTTIANNQTLRGAGLSGNVVTGVRYDFDDTRIGVPIASAPIGVPITDQGICGPGLLPVTDQIGVLTAFTVRSMGKLDNVNEEALREFIEFSRAFLDDYIDNTDVSDVFEEEPVSFFMEHYKGKRSQEWISGMVAQYVDHLDGLSSTHYDTNSCFVKLENSSKEYPNVGYRLKPRLIMTMSPPMLFECCQLLKVADKWNSGPFSNFQVKEMEPWEQSEKICQFTDQPHEATDYSSFECSVTGKLREGLEDYVIEALLQKANMQGTLTAYQKYIVGTRLLKSHGCKFLIDTRCSGDPHTSMGNGVVNVCLGVYNAYKRSGLSADVFRSTMYMNPRLIIAEGDDGIVLKGVNDPELIRELGFSYSQSVCGFMQGDCDFLRKRWIDGKMFLNIGRCLSVFWVKNKAQLSRNKQLFILRCMGSSLHHMSPGHPVLCAIVNRIGVMTRGASAFDKWYHHLDMWKWQGFSSSSYPDFVEPDESMRAAIVEGALGFPPIPFADQLRLEDIFNNSLKMDIGSLLNDYSEVVEFVETFRENTYYDKIPDDSIVELMDVVGVKYSL